jgi:hypothetical protein
MRFVAVSMHKAISEMGSRFLPLATVTLACLLLASRPADLSAGQVESGLLINEIMAANVTTVIDPDFGAFADWIEIYNPGEEAADLSHFTLTDDIRNPVRWSVPPDTIVPAGGYLLLWADGRDSGLHTNFRLSRNGEEIALYDPDGRLIDMVRFGDQAEDVSYGRTSDGAEWAFFQLPTPGRMNEGLVLERVTQTAVPMISPAGGRYEAPVEVTMRPADPGAQIHYTLDGSQPTADSALYQVPFQVAETAVVRAVAFTAGLLASPIHTQTYLINEETQLPIVSLVIDPLYLWDPEIGIYVDEHIDSRKDWERPAFIAFYEPDGSLGFQAEVSVRLFGQSAIYLPQKSLAVFVRDAGNGSDHIKYQLFPDRDLQDYASFLLRSGSDDWAGTMLRDAFGQETLEGTIDLGTQAFRPALLFVNGSYFGIHNIREKENEDYLITRYGADLDELDLLFVDQNPGGGIPEVKVLHGDAADYKALEDFAFSHNLNEAENYAIVQALLNTDHYMDYVIAESYVGNTSWHHNRKVWRAQPPFQRWDFLVYDLDRGFGRPLANVLQDMMNVDPLLGALLTNENFKNEFIQRFAQHLNVTFEPERLLAIFASLQEEIAPEIERQRARWQVADWWAENYKTEAQVTGRKERPDLPAWQDEVAHIQDFVRERPEAVRQQLIEAFSLSGTQSLTLDASRPEGGHILVQGQSLPDLPFTGVYFRDVPLRLTAVAEPGYRFVAWQGAVSSGEEIPSLSDQLSS